MGDLTKNLSRSEFLCECGCGFDTADFELVNLLQAVVDYFAESMQVRIVIVITGGNRCREHNLGLRKLFNETDGLQGANASLNSQHIYARAGDFKLYYLSEGGNRIQIKPEIVALWIEENYPAVSIGRYRNRTHADTRTHGPAKWDTTK
jgi:hypothetical protein